MRPHTTLLLASFALAPGAALAQDPAPLPGRYRPGPQDPAPGNPFQCREWTVHTSLLVINDPTMPASAPAQEVFLNATCGDLEFYFVVRSHFDVFGHHFFRNDLGEGTESVIFFEDADHQWLFFGGVYALSLTGSNNVTVLGEAWKRSKHTPDVQKVSITTPVVMTFELDYECRVFDHTSRDFYRVVHPGDDDYPDACARVTAP